MIDLKFIVESTGGELITGESNKSFNSVSTDSRRILEGQLFFAIRGENFDGHTYVKEAIEKGAAGAVVEKDPNGTEIYKNATLIKVDSTVRALGDLANAWRKKFRKLKVVCITGSNGKTTTKEMTHSILSIRYSVLKNSGNFNNNIGLPLTLLKLEDTHDICVAEIGMNDFGEIRELTNIADPDIGAITNIGRAHLEKLGDLEGVAKAKGELVENFDKDKTFIVNNDDPYTRQIAHGVNCRKVYFGTQSDKNDISARNIRQEGTRSISFDLVTGDKTLNVRIRGIGKHNVLNSLCAASIAYSLGITPEEIQAGLERYTPAHMRLEILESPQGYTIINDSYNANPDSVSRALEELASLKNNNKTIAVLGDMLELGATSAREHRMIGEMINDLKIDYTICIGKFSKCIKEGITDRSRVFHTDSHQDATSMLINIAKKGDIILVKGSRGMAMEKIIQNLFVT